MAPTVIDNIGDIERQRMILQDNVVKLGKALQHWQTWEAEYEGLKEEIEQLEDKTDHEAILRLGRGFGGNLVNEKEIKDLLGIESGLQRDVVQIVGLISRRQEYVQQNMQSAQKQVNALETQISALQEVEELEITETTEDGTLPVTNIIEQLDEHGNVTSATTSKTGESETKILDALRKAGLKDVELGQSLVDEHAGSEGEATSKKAAEDATERGNGSEWSISEVKDLQNSTPSPLRKSVSFAEDTKPADLEVKYRLPTTSTTPRISGLEVAKDLPAGARLVEVDDDDNPLGTTTIMPRDESPEDAALRREMLQYNLEQVGAVVAELDLEDDLSDGNYNEYADDLDDFEDDDDFTSDPEDEDQYGRSTRRAITDDYRKEMLELEKKLNARMIDVAGPDSKSTLLKKSNADTVGKRSADGDTTQEPRHTLREKQPRKKSVKFAEEIDIVSLEKKTNPQQVMEASRSKPQSSPKSVSEGNPASGGSGLESSKPEHFSRFKRERQDTARTSASQTIPKAPVGQILAHDLVERPSTKRDAAAPDPQGFDSAIHERDVARQYYDKRNSLIQQQGGFMPSAEDIDNPLMEEKDGTVRRVSRFRAARLNASTV